MRKVLVRDLAKRIIADRSGVSAAEYAILVVMILGALVVVLPTFTAGITSLFTILGTQLPDVGNAL
jgi:Flp pilus assembly pilin Flp